MITLPPIIIGSMLFVLSVIIPNVKSANNFIGYRTIRAMKNTANWQFAQHYFGKYMLYGSILSFIYAVISYYFLANMQIIDEVFFFCVTIYIAFCIYKTETALKVFDKNKNNNL